MLQIETEHLLFPTVVHTPHPGELIDTLGAFTGGLVRDLVKTAAIDLGIGADVTLYSVPNRLYATHGDRPVSYHIFVRLRPGSKFGSRMWDMTMTQPMRHAGMPKH